MKFGKQKNLRGSSDTSCKGRKNGFTAYIHWSAFNKCWYFTIIFPNGKRYNSGWDRLEYQKEEDCKKAAEAFIDGNKT